MTTTGKETGSITQYAAVKPFVTKDESIIRELMPPASHGNAKQSLAEAIVEPGKSTIRHYHHVSEELYHVTAGEGEVVLGEEVHEVGAGDTVHIPPGVPHELRNTGNAPLKVLCCCSPPYSDADTVLLE
jgi:mannose-6-phosphate isomerase-like protein (cupin superfamily)